MKKIVLFCKKDLNSHHVEIFIDNESNFYAERTFNDVSMICPVKGLERLKPRIPRLSSDDITKIGVFLRDNCYLKFDGANIHVHARIQGGMFGVNNLFGLLGGAAVGSGGVAIMVNFLTPLGLVAGAGVASAGINAAVYSVAADEEDLSVKECCKQGGIGFVSGVVTAGVSVTLGPGIVAAATANATGRISGRLTEAVIEQSAPDLSLGDVVGSAVGGGLAGAFIPTAVASAEAGKISTTVEVALDALKGGAQGATVSVTAQGASNLLDGRPLTEGLLQAGIAGASASALFRCLKLKKDEHELDRLIRQPPPLTVPEQCSIPQASTNYSTSFLGELRPFRRRRTDQGPIQEPTVNAAPGH